MRQENYRNKMKINRITTALLGIFFYIMLVLVLKTIQNWISVGSTGMKIFNMIEFAAIAVYMVLYTWLNFKDATQETGSRFGKYLLITMIPLVTMTILTIILSYAGTNESFGGNWNAVTFIVGPTLFCYIPYGVIFQFVSSMPMILFYMIALVLMVLFQYLGYVLGSGSRKFARERELVRAEQSRRLMQRQDEMAKQAVQENRHRGNRKPVTNRQTHVDANDPLKDIENMAVVETEAFTTITDEMIEEAIRLKKIGTTPRRTVRSNAGQMQQNNRPDQSREQTMGKTYPETRLRKQQRHTQTGTEQNKEAMQAAKNLQRELEILRKRLEKEDNNKK